MEVCKACIMLEGLNRGLPRLGVGKSTKTLEQFERLKVSDCDGDGDGNASQRLERAKQAAKEF